MGWFASVNGSVMPAEEARISVLDNGFMFGDSVYETLRTYRGRPFHLDRHLARLRRSADRVGIPLPLPDAELEGRVQALLATAAHEESYLRIIVSRGVGELSYRFDRVKGPTVVMVAKPYEPPPASCYGEGIDLIISSVRRNHPRTVDPAIKSGNLINNIMAVRESQAKGAFEPILLNLDGEVAEGASSNVFAVLKSHLVTPPLSAGILPGVTRQLVIEIAGRLGTPTHEETIRVADLMAASEVFITSSLKELVPVRQINERRVPAPVPGPHTTRLLQAYREYAAAGH